MFRVSLFTRCERKDQLRANECTVGESVAAFQKECVARARTEWHKYEKKRGGSDAEQAQSGEGSSFSLMEDAVTRRKN